MNTKLLLVHGAWQGAWVWDDVVRLLAARGVEAIAIDLPGSGEDETAPGDVDLAGYAQAIVRRAHAMQPARVVLVGHSMGGAAITAAAAVAPELFDALVYLCAFLPRPGESVAALAKEGYALGGAGPKVEVVEGGRATRLLADSIADTFFNDCAPETVVALLPRFRQQPTAPIGAPAQWSDGFRALPKHYIHCARDNAIAPRLQLVMAERASVTDVRTLDSGHEPFISQSLPLVELLLDVAGT